MYVLFAVDLSEPTPTVRTAEDFADRLGGDLLVLHVVPPYTVAPLMPLDPLTGLTGYAPYTAYDVSLERDIEHATARAFHSYLAERFPRPVRAALRTGDPARIILSDAEEQGAGVIIMGKRQHSRMQHFLLGSVTNQVIRHSTVPTILIPIQE
ncbi:MAG TPA: universal stress protein [Rhodothermales bacterium]|nr:universal stress protein [Rhodothermales bacterium]